MCIFFSSIKWAYFKIDLENAGEKLNIYKSFSYKFIKRLNSLQAFAIAEEYFGIPPKISGHDLVRQAIPDKLAIIAYVSLYYEALKGEPPGKCQSFILTFLI